MKLKRLFSGLLVSLIAIVSVLLCVKVSNAAEVTFKKVKDANDLAVGDVIAIVNESKNAALSTTQNKNNRGKCDIEISKGSFNSTTDVEEITLENGTKTGTYAFKVSEGYLYAASSKSNHLKTQVTNNDNGSWTISISSGNATIKAQGTNSHNLLKYNSSSSLFSCYEGGQNDVQIYKKEISITTPKPATAVEFEKVETMSSLSFDWATTDGKDYTFSNVSLRFGNLFTKDAYTEGATYGLLLIQNSDLDGSDFATYLAGKTLDDITADTKIKNVDATPVKVNAQGVADKKGEYYQFAVVLSDMEEYLTTSITAVMYVVIDGQIYYSVEKTASVQSTADAYISDKALMETLDKDVKNAILALSIAE